MTSVESQRHAMPHNAAPWLCRTLPAFCDLWAWQNPKIVGARPDHGLQLAFVHPLTRLPGSGGGGGVGGGRMQLGIRRFCSHGT